MYIKQELIPPVSNYDILVINQPPSTHFYSKHYFLLFTAIQLPVLVSIYNGNRNIYLSVLDLFHLIMVSTSMHVVANDTVSPFLYLSDTPLRTCTTLSID